MSFWKDYPNRKDHRQPSRKHSKGCLNHGDCSWCRGNRTHSTDKRIESATADEDTCHKCGGDIADCACTIERQRLLAERNER